MVHLRLGGNAFAFSMMEIPLVLGLFFVRPDLLVVARLVGGLAAYAWQRKALVKTAFNCALFVLETSAAVAVWNFVVGAADPVSPVGWLATGLAVIATGVISSTLVTGVILIVSGELPGSLDEVFSLGQLGDLANAALALVGVYILSADWRAVWLLGVVVVVLAVAYRSYEGARTRSESLEQVNRFTEMVGRDVEVDAVVRSVLNEVGTALPGADRPAAPEPALRRRRGLDAGRRRRSSTGSPPWSTGWPSTPRAAPSSCRATRSRPSSHSCSTTRACATA